MPYATGRAYCDADSHLMELGDWLAPYADPGIREKLRPLYLGGAGKLAEQAVDAAAARRGDAEAARALEAKLMSAKGWGALGAFDRDRALARARPARLREPARVQHLRGDTVRWRRPRAPLRRHARHNRAIADFCSEDERLVASAWCRGAIPSGPSARRTRRSGSAAARSC